MFRKMTNIKLGFPDENHFTYNDDYNSVMQFVSKNKVIPAKLAEFENSQSDYANITTLADAIANGNLQDSIFHHTDCQLYT